MILKGPCMKLKPGVVWIAIVVVFTNYITYTAATYFPNKTEILCDFAIKRISELAEKGNIDGIKKATDKYLNGPHVQNSVYTKLLTMWDY